MECNNCFRQIEGPREIFRYQEKYFCSEECLKEYLYYHTEDEITTEWLDTAENIKTCVTEAKNDY